MQQSLVINPPISPNHNPAQGACITPSWVYGKTMSSFCPEWERAKDSWIECDRQENFSSQLPIHITIIHLNHPPSHLIEPSLIDSTRSCLRAVFSLRDIYMRLKLENIEFFCPQPQSPAIMLSLKRLFKKARVYSSVHQFMTRMRRQNPIAGDQLLVYDTISNADIWSSNCLILWNVVQIVILPSLESFKVVVSWEIYSLLCNECIYFLPPGRKSFWGSDEGLCTLRKREDFREGCALFTPPTTTTPSLGPQMHHPVP